MPLCDVPIETGARCGTAASTRGYLHGTIRMVHNDSQMPSVISIPLALRRSTALTWSTPPCQPVGATFKSCKNDGRVALAPDMHHVCKVVQQNIAFLLIVSFPLKRLQAICRHPRHLQHATCISAACLLHTLCEEPGAWPQRHGYAHPAFQPQGRHPATAPDTHPWVTPT